MSQIDIEKKTPSEVVMDMLEDFGRAEPEYVVIVCLNKENEIVVKTNDMDYIRLAGVGSYLQNVAGKRMIVD